MTAGGGARRRVVLIGAGHAHLHAIRHASEFARRGFELTLVAPDRFWYSGLATGMLGGTYRPAEDQVDVAGLVGRGGGRFVRDRAEGLDPVAKTIRLASGPSVPYDVASLDVGSVVPTRRIPGLHEHGIPVKPIRNLWRLRRALEIALTRTRHGRPLRLVVVGDGPSACEVAGNARRLADDRGGVLAVTVLARADRLLPGLSESASRGVAGNLAGRGVTIVDGSAVERVEPGVAIAAGGGRHPFDLLVAATGLVPPPMLRRTGLPADEEGALLVDEHLRSVADPHVFGGGDGIALPGRSLARIGVHAVREAPILTHNLLATLEGRPLSRFSPRRRSLLILNLGDGTGLATWGPLHWQGRAAHWLKDRIDRRFLRRSRTPARPD